MAKVDLSGRFKNKRVPWSDEELRLTLGYYFSFMKTIRESTTMNCLQII